MLSIMVKYIILLSFLCLPVVKKANGKGVIGAPMATIQVDTVKHDTAKYAVFNIDKIRGDFFQLFKKADNATVLSREDFIRIEQLTKEAVAKFNKGQEQKNEVYVKKKKRKYPNYRIIPPNILIQNPSQYYKQLVPVINEKQEKLVWVRCVCQRDKNEWKEDISLVEDGGSCYFNLKINLTRNSYSDFALN